MTSILTWVKKWPKWFRNDFSQAFERRLSFFSTSTRSRDHGGVQTPLPQQAVEIQRPSKAQGYRIKVTIPPCSKLFFIPRLYVSTFSTFYWSCWSFFFKKYCVTCKKSTLKVLINFGFVTSFENSHYTLLFRYIYGARNTVILLFKTPSCRLLFLSMK